MFRRPPHPPGMMQGHERPGDIRQLVIHELRFSKEQEEQYALLVREHRSAMDSMDEQSRTILTEYFGLLKSATTDKIQQDSLEHSLGNIQQEKLSLTLNHFSKVKAICNDAQKSGFENLIPEFLKVLNPAPRENHHPHERENPGERD